MNESCARIKMRRLLNKTNNRCHLCGDLLVLDKPIGCSEDDWALIRPTKDHIIPRCNGGFAVIGNLMPAHYWCNERRNNIPVAFHRMFVLFRKFTDVGKPEDSERKKKFLIAKSKFCLET